MFCTSVPKEVKDVDGYKFALIYYSQSDSRDEVELFTTEKEREARKDNLQEAGIKAGYAHVNRTY